mmetsp:Transcript_7628/g.24005  ORF Transcript_7628/g.24005 Transcript_7628/m.24005 type:complete len:193 (+) Transcript_7628:573-1151(+)
MSATLDLTRYTSFLKGPDRHEAVNLVIVDSEQCPTNVSSYFNVEVLYLEDLPRRIGIDHDKIAKVSAAATEGMRNEEMTGYSLNLDVHAIAYAVIAKTIKRDQATTTLVFLPTYRTLEIQYGILKAAPFAADVDVQVLHSSLEIASLLDDRGPLGHEALRDIGHERRGELAHDFGRRRRGGPVLDESSYLGL